MRHSFINKYCWNGSTSWNHKVVCFFHSTACITIVIMFTKLDAHLLFYCVSGHIFSPIWFFSIFRSALFEGINEYYSAINRCLLSRCRRQLVPIGWYLTCIQHIGTVQIRVVAKLILLLDILNGHLDEWARALYSGRDIFWIMRTNIWLVLINWGFGSFHHLIVRPGEGIGLNIEVLLNWWGHLDVEAKGRVG